MPYQKYQGPALFFRHLDTKNLDWQMNSQPIKSKHCSCREREAAHTMAGLNPLLPKYKFFKSSYWNGTTGFCIQIIKGPFYLKSAIVHSAQCQQLYVCLELQQQQQLKNSL